MIVSNYLVNLVGPKEPWLSSSVSLEASIPQIMQKKNASAGEIFNMIVYTNHIMLFMG